jgi:hypothetical protein
LRQGGRADACRARREPRCAGDAAALLRPARWLFRFVEAATPVGAEGIEARVDQVDTTLQVNPVAGFLLPDHLDESLEVFGIDGAPIGELLHEAVSGGVVWEIAAGREGPADAGPNHGLAPAQRALADFAAALVAADSSARAGLPLDPSGLKESALSALLRAIDTTLWTVDSMASLGSEHVAGLVGRPIAVVRAQLRLELMAPIDIDLSDRGARGRVGRCRAGRAAPRLRAARRRARAQRRRRARFLRRRRLHAPQTRRQGDRGHRHRRGPAAAASSASMRRCPTSRCPMRSSIRMRFRTDEADTLEVHIGQTVTLTILMHPAGKVTLSSGLLPRKALALARDWVSQGLAAMAPSLRTGPVLVETDLDAEGQVRLPKVSVFGKDQNFLWRNTPATWRTDAILAATQTALMPDEPAALREGWIRVAPPKAPRREGRHERAWPLQSTHPAARSAEGSPVSRYDWPIAAAPARARTMTRTDGAASWQGADRTSTPRAHAARRAAGRLRIAHRHPPAAPRRVRARICGSRSARRSCCSRTRALRASAGASTRSRCTRWASGCMRHRPTAGSGTRATAVRFGVRSPGSRRPPPRASCGPRIAMPATPSRVQFGGDETSDEVWVGTGEVSTSIDGQPGHSLGGVGILHALHPAAPDEADPWKIEATNLAGSGVYKIALEPGGSRVLAATRIGLFERPAAGALNAPWNLVQAAPFDNYRGQCSDVMWTAAVPGGAPARVWVWLMDGANPGLYCRDMGSPPAAAFVRVAFAAGTPAGTTYQALRGALAASTPPTQVWAVSDAGSNVPPDLFRVASTAAPPAASPVLVTQDILGTQGDYDIAIDVDPADPNRVVLGGSFFDFTTAENIAVTTAGRPSSSAMSR